MSDFHERLLIDPTPPELIEALLDATRAANYGRGAFRYHGGHWHDFVRQAQPECEGYRRWPLGTHPDPGVVSAAWWTDHQGRRHFRVWGGRTSADPYRRGAGSDEDPRPPLWHVYPDRVFRRTGQGRDEWLAACACGVCGPPASLAWMGDCCGPCHDRREEGAAADAARPPTTLGRSTPGPVHGVAFAPDGRTLAAAAEGRALRLYDLTIGAARDLAVGEDGEEFRGLTFSPDGRWLAMGDPHEGVRLLDLKGGDPVVLEMDEGPVHSLAFAPDGLMLAGWWGNGLGVWGKGPGTPWVFQRGRYDGTAADFSPDGKTLAVGRGMTEVSLLETAGWSERRSWFTETLSDHDVLFVAFTPAGETLLSVTGPSLEGDGPLGFRPLPEEARLKLWDLVTGRERAAATIPYASAYALSPDGRWLAWVVHDQRHSPAAVTFWDVEAWRERCRLEWNPEDMVYDLAFSPDGRTLATGCGSGAVKLWPWRDLLEAETP